MNELLLGSIQMLCWANWQALFLFYVANAQCFLLHCLLEAGRGALALLLQSVLS